MSRIKFSVLTALAVFVVSAISVSAASAAEFELTKVKCEGTGITTFCWEAETGTKEGLQELKGTQTFTVTLDAGTETLLTSKLGTEEIHITCTAVAASGTPLLSQPEPLVKAPTASFKLKFTGCKVLEPLGATCAVSETLETETIEGTFPTAEEVQFKPAAGAAEPFITIKVTSVPGKTCLNEGANKVTGKQKCLWATPSEDLKEQLLTCLATESELKFGSKNAAEFLLESTIKPEPLTGDLYDIVLA